MTELEELKTENFDCADGKINALVRWLNDLQLMQFSEQRHKTHDRDSCIAYALSFKGTDNDYLSILYRDRFIGTATIYRSYKDRRADIGLLIGPEFNGNGFGTEAFRLICSELSENGLLEKLTAGTIQQNIGMVRVLEANGFKLECRREKHIWVDGQPMDQCLYAKFI